MDQNLLPDAAVLDEIGERIARQRVDLGLTQAELATQAGIGRATVERLETGHSTQMSSFIRVLRVLGLLDDFLAVAPDSSPRPMDLLKKSPGVRKRASSRRKSVDENDPWTWSDDS